MVLGVSWLEIRLYLTNLCHGFIGHIISVYESFKEYIAVETLDGDNKYDAGEYGLQVCVLLEKYFYSDFVVFCFVYLSYASPLNLISSSFIRKLKRG